MAGKLEKNAGGEDRQPWYAGGLRFECQADCGACCVSHEDYAYVYLANGDLGELARHLELSEEEFRDRYTTLDDGSLVLRMDGPSCPFLAGSRCSVYAARPTQCRTFPFWRENVRSPATWDRLAAFCPGIGRGPVHVLHVIQDHARRRGD